MYARIFQIGIMAECIARMCVTLDPIWNCPALSVLPSSCTFLTCSFVCAFLLCVLSFGVLRMCSTRGQFEGLHDFSTQLVSLA